ncbi:MAG: hypothetical protein N2691_00335 [Patescibacteria group bacterium]|nr:hypothetical protein [Patescibacteria group bacterium]
MDKFRPALAIYRKFVRFTNKVIVVMAVLLAISGLFIHYHQKDIVRLKNPKDAMADYRYELYSILNSPKLTESQAGQMQRALLRESFCALIGEACTDDPADADANFSGSVLGMATGLMTLPFANPPASGIAWLHDGMQNAGFTPAVYAQGLGFNSLTAYSTIWKLFRNITYFLIAIGIVVVGFMIMFRYQIDSNTVISIENSLPRIVITLLLITFSFAIVGFMVDLMYILLLICFGLFGGLNIPSLSAQYLQDLYIHSEAPLITSEFYDARYLHFYVQGIQGLVDFIPSWIKSLLYPIVAGWLFYLIVDAVDRTKVFTPINQIIGEGGIVLFNVKAALGYFVVLPVLYTLILFAIPLFLQIILPVVLGLVIMLFLFFRILFMLISAYVRILIDIIFAPIMILPSVIPGNDAFMSWLRRIFGNMLVFPLTIVLLIVVQLVALNDEQLIGWGQYEFGRDTVGWSIESGLPQFTLPPLNMDTSRLAPIIAAAFMLLIPQLVRQVQEQIAGKPVIDAGPAALFGGVAGAAGAVVGQYAGLAQFAKLVDPDTALGNFIRRVPLINQVTGAVKPKNKSENPVPIGEVGSDQSG